MILILFSIASSNAANHKHGYNTRTVPYISSLELAVGST